MSTEISLEREQVPFCPKCGSRMRAVNGKRGIFWGCTYYPDCNGTRHHSENHRQSFEPRSYTENDDEEQCFRDSGACWDPPF